MSFVDFLKDAQPLLQTLAGGGFAYLGLRHSLDKAEARDAEQRANELRSLLQALLVEMTISRDAWKPISHSIEEAGDDGVLDIFPIRDNPFPIFSGSSSSIGLIENETLRDAIVRSYFFAYGMLDSVRYNNQLSLSWRSNPNSDQSNRAALQLAGYVRGMKKQNALVKSQYQTAIELLKSEAIKHGIDVGPSQADEEPKNKSYE